MPGQTPHTSVRGKSCRSVGRWRPVVGFAPEPTPLILTQPEEVVPTAAASEKNGFEGGWEGVEAMDMVR